MRISNFPPFSLKISIVNKIFKEFFRKFFAVFKKRSVMFAKMFAKTKRRKTHGVTVRCLKVTADERGERSGIKRQILNIYITRKKIFENCFCLLQVP
jgi:hypothetical protein